MPVASSSQMLWQHSYHLLHLPSPSPLPQFAVKRSHTEASRVLLESGADFQVRHTMGAEEALHSGGTVWIRRNGACRTGQGMGEETVYYNAVPLHSGCG